MSESIGNGRFFSSSLVAAPGVVHVLAVGAHAEQLRIARLEFLVELAERGDLGRAHEGEVLRPEEDHAPLALVAVVGRRAGRPCSGRSKRRRSASNWGNFCPIPSMLSLHRMQSVSGDGAWWRPSADSVQSIDFIISIDRINRHGRPQAQGPALPRRAGGQAPFRPRGGALAS